MELAVEGHFARGGARLALQSCLQSLFDEALFEMLEGACCHAECRGHIGYFPRLARTIRPGVAKKKSAGMYELGCIGFSGARGGLQQLALLFCEGDSVSRCHAA